jgi:hypothetical protein
MVPRVLALHLSVITAVAIAGCGGGGSGSGGSGGATPQNLDSASAPSQPMATPSTTLTAMDSAGNTYTVTYSSTPGGMMTFNGQSASTSVIALSIAENGTVLATEDSTAYFLTNPYSPLGLSGTTGGMTWTAVVTSYTPLPSKLTVGASGSLDSFTYKNGMGTVIGSLTETYTVTADSPTELFLNINAAGTINGLQETELLTFSIASNGTVTGLVQAQITVNGTTLTFH